MKPHATGRRPLLRAASLLLATLAGAAALAATPQDKIFQKHSAKFIPGTIKEETIDGIKTTSGLEFSPLGIDRIEYGDRPHAFYEGMEHLKQGRYQDAIRFYGSALRSKLVTPERHAIWLDANCRYYIALCYLEEGSDMAAAEARFKELLDKHPKTRFLPDAYLGLGRVQFVAKKYDAALAQFDKLASLAVVKHWDEWLYVSLLWKSRTFLEQKNYPEALKTVKKVVDSADPQRHGDIVVEARTVEATIYVRTSRYDRAAELLRGLIRSVGQKVAVEIERGGDRMQRTEAQCYNALGQCYLKQAEKTKKELDYREAVLAFLWTVVLHQQRPAEHAEALYHAAICFDKLDQRRRATELRNELADKHPDSPYARMVQSPGAAAAKKESAK